MMNQSESPEQRKKEAIKKMKDLEKKINSLIKGLGISRAEEAYKACYNLLSLCIKTYSEFPGDDTLEMWDKAVDIDDKCSRYFDIPYFTKYSYNALVNEYLSEIQSTINLPLVRAFIPVIIEGGGKGARNGKIEDAMASCNLTLNVSLLMCEHTGYNEQALEELLKLWINRVEYTAKRLKKKGFKDAAKAYTQLLDRAKRKEPILPEYEHGMDQEHDFLFTTLARLL